MSGAKEQVAPQASQSWRIVGSVARGGGLPIVSPRHPPVDDGPQVASPARPTPTSHAASGSGSDGRDSNLRLPFLQRELAVGAVDDPLEREADSVADAVMSSGTLRLDPIATSSLSSRDFLPNYWRKCQARVAKALKKRARAAAEQSVNGFKKVVADRVAAHKSQARQVGRRARKSFRDVALASRAGAQGRENCGRQSAGARDDIFRPAGQIWQTGRGPAGAAEAVAGCGQALGPTKMQLPYQE